MAFSICYWANYTQVKTKLSPKSEKPWRMTRFWSFCIKHDLRHV